jgi:NhaA family Na+:H+ antiporter
VKWRRALPFYPLLPLGALIAIVWANTDGDSYFTLAQALAFPVNDIGVAFGLASLAQEVLEAASAGGTLPSRRYLWLAVTLGVGSAIIAAASYAAYIQATDEQMLLGGWPIACGVDVFFGLALARSIFRRGLAVTIVVIVALVSDVIALLVISRRPFVTGNPAALGLIACAVVASMVLRRRGVRTMWTYLLVGGPLAWLGCFWAGVHPALALLPIVPFFPRSPRALDDLSSHRHDHASLTHFESALAYPLQAVAFLFGLVNAGVLWRGFGTGTWAVLTASLAGRPLGVLITAAALTVIGVESERYVCWRDLVVIACIVTVGSVFALFVSTAVFPVGPLLMQAKLGAIATLAGVPIAAAAARALRVGRFAGSAGV